MILSHQRVKRIVSDTIYERGTATSPGFFMLDSFQITMIAQAAAAEIADQEEVAGEQYYQERVEEIEASKQEFEPA